MYLKLYSKIIGEIDIMYSSSTRTYWALSMLYDRVIYTSWAVAELDWVRERYYGKLEQDYTNYFNKLWC